MTELDLIIDLHKIHERQGPGSNADTLRALSCMDLPKDRTMKIADLGCGTGSQTHTLAKQLDSEIIAVDLFDAFLTTLHQKSEKRGLSQKISTLQHSMDDLPFEKETFDIIWSEGAIYNMGFEKGIKAWKEFLRPGGYLAVSEITWISSSRPVEIETFWTTEYPEISMASTKIEQLEKNGYSLAGYFYLSPESWLENYYLPIENGLQDFLDRHGNSGDAQAVAQAYRDEIDLYKRFKDYYSYGFYIARKS